MFDLSNKRIIDEAQSADYKAASDFPRLFHNIVKDYEIRNIFNLDSRRNGALLETVAGQIDHFAWERNF